MTKVPKESSPASKLVEHNEHEHGRVRSSPSGISLSIDAINNHTLYSSAAGEGNYTGFRARVMNLSVCLGFVK